MRGLVFLLFVIVGIAITSGRAELDTLAGTARAFKGDVVIIGGAKVQLFGIDAPEPHQQCESESRAWACGAAAKSALRERVNGKHLECRVHHKVGHGYWQGTCLLEGVDVGEAQVRAGWARAIPSLSDTYKAAETEARATNRGLWQAR